MSVQKKNYQEYFKNRGEFTMVPNGLWELSDLNPYAKVIWAYIVSRSQKWSSSRNNIARNLHLNNGTVSKCVKQLQDLNMLRVLAGPRNSWSFVIIPPSDWVTRSSTVNSDRLISQSISSLPNSPVVNHGTNYTQEEAIREEEESTSLHSISEPASSPIISSPENNEYNKAALVFPVPNERLLQDLRRQQFQETEFNNTCATGAKEDQ